MYWGGSCLRQPWPSKYFPAFRQQRCIDSRHMEHFMVGWSGERDGRLHCMQLTGGAAPASSLTDFVIARRWGVTIGSSQGVGRSTRGVSGPRLRRRYTIRFARTEPADFPVHGSIVTCAMSLECPGHLKIGWKGFTARSIFEPILPPELCDYPIRAQQTPRTTFTLYDCERETGGVSQCT